MCKVSCAFCVIAIGVVFSLRFRSARVAVALIVLLSVSAPPEIRAQTQPVLRIGIIPSEFAAQPWYAQDLGMFAKAGVTVDIEPISSGAAGAAAVISGALDIVYSNVLSLAIAHDKGFPLIALADANIYSPKAWSSGVLAVKRTSPLGSAASFSGKTIAVGGLHNVLELGGRAWLDANGGDSNKVSWVEIKDPEMEAAVMSDRVDGAIMSGGINPQLGKPAYPIRIVAPALNAIAPTYDVAVWVASSDWLASHADIASRFVAVMRDAARWANTHHHESALILAKYTKRTAPDIEAGVRYIYGDHLTSDMLQPQIDAAAKYGWLNRFPARELIAKPARDN
jgi:NitT/TauT family transport system substrate-binding protein